jgi:hypothetical protein
MTHNELVELQLKIDKKVMELTPLLELLNEEVGEGMALGEQALLKALETYMAEYIE